MKTSEVDSYRRKLQAMRNRLDAREIELRDEVFHGAGGDSVGDLSVAPIHPADLGNFEFEAVVNQGLAVNEASLLQEIAAALLRMDAGTFGICGECRSAIDRERLRAVPYSRLCIRCAKREQ
jgi:DnaK suppressor protein